MASPLQHRGGLVALVLILLSGFGLSDLGPAGPSGMVGAADETTAQPREGEAPASASAVSSTLAKPSSSAPAAVLSPPSEAPPAEALEAEEDRLDRARNQRVRRNLARLERAGGLRGERLTEPDRNPAYAHALRARAESIRDLFGS